MFWFLVIMGTIAIVATIVTDKVFTEKDDEGNNVRFSSAGSNSSANTDVDNVDNNANISGQLSRNRMKLALEFYKNDEERFSSVVSDLEKAKIHGEISRYAQDYGKNIGFVYLVFRTTQLFAQRFLAGVSFNSSEITTDARFLASFADSTVLAFEFPYANDFSGQGRDNFCFRLFPSKEEALLDGDNVEVFNISEEELDDMLFLNRAHFAGSVNNSASNENTEGTESAENSVNIDDVSANEFDKENTEHKFVTISLEIIKALNAGVKTAAYDGV